MCDFGIRDAWEVHKSHGYRRLEFVGQRKEDMVICPKKDDWDEKNYLIQVLNLRRS